MKVLLRVFALLVLALPGLLPPQATSFAEPVNNSCLYPSLHERFGVTGKAYAFDMSQLPAGAYHDWWASSSGINPNGMHYLPLVHTGMNGYYPGGDQLRRAVLANLGATWLIGNEADTPWMDNTTPEAYARQFFEISTLIRSIDPTAKLGFSGFATVTPLRLAWLDRAWNTYLDLYGEEMPVDVWNVHTYVVNEMVHEWGPQIPAGFDNVLAYGNGPWTEVSLAGASGGTAHESNTSKARAYFVFQGGEATVHLLTGPDSGRADIYIDSVMRETVDLYTPEPGTMALTYSGLRPGDSRLQNWHHVRVEVRGSDGWVRVDALEAPSTAQLPGGRLEDDFPLRATLVTTTNEYTSINRMGEQLRLFRQWMADHGQRNKPLINSEYGVLLGENVGFGYSEVRDYMLRSFDYLLYEAIDPELGYPEDDNRLLQQWFWYTLVGEYFNGSRNHSGLLDPNSGQLSGLGQDFVNYIQPYVTNYSDLEVLSTSITPIGGSLFAGDPVEVRVQAQVRNRGNVGTGSFTVTLADGSGVKAEWPVGGLTELYGSNDTYVVDQVVSLVIVGNPTLSLVADRTGQVDEPCEPNNTVDAQLAAPSPADFALSDLAVSPSYMPIPFPGTAARASFQVSLSNLGNLGTTADQIVLRLWDGDPSSGGVIVATQALLPGTDPLAPITINWEDVPSGTHQVTVEVVAAPGETNLTNNRLQTTIHVPSADGLLFLPLFLK